MVMMHTGVHICSGLPSLLSRGKLLWLPNMLGLTSSSSLVCVLQSCLKQLLENRSRWEKTLQHAVTEEGAKDDRTRNDSRFLDDSSNSSSSSDYGDGIDNNAVHVVDC